MRGRKTKPCGNLRVWEAWSYLPGGWWVRAEG